MADFAAVLKKTLEQMGETTPEARGKVYDKARDTVRRQIDSMEKTPPQAAIDRQFEKLEEAIKSVEVEYAFQEESLDADNSVDEVLVETPGDEQVVPVEDAVEPEEDIDPEIAREAESESEPSFGDDVEPSPMPTPDEVVAEVTTVSPEEVAQFADGSADTGTSTDPLADFINEHSNV
ncbi:MAG: hypothetical protein AAGF25_12100, partial [Pseudomonadota bacterium]